MWITYGGAAAREAAALAATFPTDGVGDLQALVVEILVTFILMFVVMVATDERAPAGVAPLAVGFALACRVLDRGPAPLAGLVAPRVALWMEVRREAIGRKPTACGARSRSAMRL